MQTRSEQSEALGRISPIDPGVDYYLWNPGKRPVPCGYVYFITWGENNPVKIGWSRVLESRLKTLQTSFPYDLEIRKVLPADSEQLEAQLHRYLANYRMRGEWFRQSGRVKSVMESAWDNENLPDPEKVLHNMMPAHLSLRKDEDRGLSVRCWSVVDTGTQEKYITGLARDEAKVIIKKLTLKPKEEVYRAVRAIQENVLDTKPPSMIQS